ncbi:hypothetical protein PPL_03178 [Heterostelium album PN500]|uniref:Fe2OG dioxygenase domain-containing protein n=1 Tax=Heterostelium pallidum (strain ATCC 26659 / Pp 5 / PN500) TaxID=670386 RepID=D3B457_HETP5|nr:hypothetical protein PPL_03178 [Heterostelium album PN500]EFA84105.1 hypothetical protein PPL_03178 [Heterostelium album PN500]|eukprot:XP_020436222.1 hypothetical protein PPL_03178 [Heterostelium album PN500]
MEQLKSLPIIDISGLWSDDVSKWNKVAKEIDEVSRGIGFFYIVGHQIPSERFEKMMEISRFFFGLPMEKKLEVDMTKNQFHRGYGGFQLEQLNPLSPHDEKETLEFGMKMSPDNPLYLHKLYGPNPRPSAFDQATIDLIDEHYLDMKNIICMLLRAIASALNLDREYFARHYDYPLAAMRLMHYTANLDLPNTGEIVLGGGEHTDYGILTILQQDDVGGLQVKTMSDEWIDVPFVKDSYVVNIGDMLQRWTNDIYRSTAHRVLRPPKGVHRYSIPFFGEPHTDTIVECIPSCCSDSSPPKYKPISAGDYLQSRFLDTYEYKKQKY